MLALIHGANASLDDKMSKYLSYWTTDETDPRSRATLRHFLTMTSGMVTDGTDGAVALNNSDAKARVAHSKVGYGAFLGCSLVPGATHGACARALYDASPALYAPG